MKAVYKGEVIADSEDTVIVDGAHYFPLDSVRTELLTDSSHKTYCGWKGDCKYYNVEVAGESPNQNAAWYYPEPFDAAKAVKGRVAFWKGVEVKP